LIKALSPTLGKFLVLTELQLRYSAKMPLRVRAYTALAEEKYELPVYAVLVNILPPARNVIIPNRHERTFLGQQSRQDYQVINLWEVEAEMVFDQNLVTLMPFVPILKGGDDETLVRRAVQILQWDEQLTELESLLGFFASFVLETELIAQILRWDMAVLRESPWYQEILQQGEQRGAQREAAALMLRQLAYRFGTLSPSLAARIEGLALEQLEALSLAWLDWQGVEEIERWLESQ
jgi:predicted transposase YdaD